MGGLGAGAGAFEGDNERADQSARRTGLNLQGAQLAQNDRQFAARQQLGREQMALDTAESERRRQDNQKALEMQQANTDKRFAMDERQFQAGQQADVYQRGRDERKDAWGEALSAQELQDRQEKIKMNRLQFDELDRASKMEREKMTNRQQMAKTGLGALALTAMKNGGIASQSAIELFNKQQEQAGTGIKVSSGVWSADGFSFKRRGPGQDQNGRPIEVDYDEVMSPAIARTLFKDEFGEDIAEEQSTSQRDSAKFAQQKSLAETKVLPEDRLVKLTNAAKAMVDAGMEVPETLNEQIKSLSRGGQSAPAPLPAKAASEVPKDVIDYAANVKKMSLTKPVNERAAFYDMKMKGYMANRSSGPAADKQQTPGAAPSTSQPAVSEEHTNESFNEPVQPAQKQPLGPEKGDTSYWRDMPTGVNKPSVKEMRNDILKRRDATYDIRIPKEQRLADRKRIDAELEAFNKANPI